MSIDDVARFGVINRQNSPNRFQKIVIKLNGNLSENIHFCTSDLSLFSAGNQKLAIKLIRFSSLTSPSFFLKR